MAITLQKKYGKQSRMQVSRILRYPAPQHVQNCISWLCKKCENLSNLADHTSIPFSG